MDSMSNSREFVYSCGNNLNGQLGLGDTKNRNNPTKIKCSIGKTGKVKNGIHAGNFSCGYQHSVIINENGDVFVCGESVHGELGLGEEILRSAKLGGSVIYPTQILNFQAVQVSCGFLHTIFIDISGNVLSCGHGDDGQLGINIPSSEQLAKAGNRSFDVGKSKLCKFFDVIKSPTLIPNYTSIIVDYSRISLDPYKNLPHHARKIKYSACGNFHTVLIDSHNNIYTFGSNVSSQLGIAEDTFNMSSLVDMKGNIRNIYRPTQVPKIKAKYVACGFSHTVIIDQDDNVLICGNFDGKSGSSAVLNIDTFAQIPNLKARKVACGKHHTAIIDFDYNIFVFGDNNYGQLGLGDDKRQPIATQIKGFKVKNIACGSYHTLFIDFDCNVFAFGLNDNGQLGLGDNFNRYIPTQILGFKASDITCGGNHTLLMGRFVSFPKINGADPSINSEIIKLSCDKHKLPRRKCLDCFIIYYNNQRYTRIIR